MRLQHLKTIQPAGTLKENGRFPRITSICWSPNNYKFAIANSDRNIIVYDADGKQRDKFATKSGNKEDTVKKYQITAIEFSPDSSKLAIAQTDNIVYIYRLGQDATKFGEKKSICNKFSVSSPVTALCWPNKRNDELVFGLASGKLKIGILKINGERKNKSATLFETNSFVNHIVSNTNGDYFYSIHANKCIYQYIFPNINNTNSSAKKVLFAQLSFIPNTIQITCAASKHNPIEDVVVTSINGNIQILNGENGEIKQHFEHNALDNVKLIECAAMSPSAQSIVFGAFNCFFVLSYNRKNNQWNKGYKYDIDNIGSITNIKWKYDGSKLSISSMIGTVDFYEACLKKYKYSDRFSIVYTALNSVIVVDRFSDDKITIKSNLGTEIKTIEIIQNRFVVAKTEKSLICCDMNEIALFSEIAWHSNENEDDGDEIFNFDTNGIVIIFYSSELFIVELGSNDILSSCRTEFNSPHLVSLRMLTNKKIIAYLLDLQSICVMDLERNIEIICINHELKIEWIELNEFGNELLFMDKKRSLHLYHIESNNNKEKKEKRKTLLNFCNYAQWVPESNVIVAQNRNNLCVWYNIHHTKQVTIVDISGDVQDIQRSHDKTIVVVNEGNNNIIEYTLNETLITFANAFDNKQYKNAVNKLERLCSKMDISNNCEIQSMWKQISQIALKNHDYKVAHRCFIALGDISKANYLYDMIENDDDANAKLAIFNKQFKKAESIYISNGQIDSAIIIYLKLNKYQDAIKLCKLRKHPLLNDIKQKYFDYLMSTQQHKKAAKLKEIDGDYLGAVHIYLDKGFAVNALQLIIKHSIPINEITEDIYHTLTDKQQDYESAGLLFEYLNDFERAFNIYIEGHCYSKAIELAKKNNSNMHFGDKVIEIEAKWGQYLYDKSEFNNALHHFIESAKYIQATECAIKSKQFSKAIEILKNIKTTNENTQKVCTFYKDIAKYYEECKKYKIAEKLYIKSGFIKKAIMMQLNAGNLSRSNELAMDYLPDMNITDFYLEEASKLESNGKTEQAAAILVKANDIDAAIVLLQKYNKLNKIIEIIEKYKVSDTTLKRAYLLIANQLKNNCNFKSAEMYFLKANEWKAAVRMYDDNSMMDEALNICRKYGGFEEFSNMVYEYCLSFNDDAKAVEMLLNYNLSNKCIDYLLNRGLFARAFEIAEQYATSTDKDKDKLNEIHYQYALYLEDRGDFSKAEEEFLECNKAKEAIEMYIHEKNWDDAIRVAQIHEAGVIQQVYKAHGIVSMEENNLSEAEKWFTKAETVEDAIKMYQDRSMYDDALRLAHQYVPSFVHELQMKQLQMNSNKSNTTTNEFESIVNKANYYKDNGNYDDAVDLLLTLQHPQHVEDVNEIISYWEEAVHISMEKALVNLPTTIGYVAKQLLDIGEYEKSAQYFLEINDHKSAINSFICGKMFKKAEQVCKIYSCEYLLNDIHESGEKPQSAFQDSQSLFKDAKYIQALNILNESDLESKLQKSNDINTLTFYSDLMKMILVQTNNLDTIFIETQEAMNVFGKCKKILHCIVNWIKKTNHNIKECDHELNKFEELLYLFHLLYIKYQCCDILPTVYNKQCVSLLSYCDWIRCDLLFYDAGSSSKQIKQYQDAFIYFNHFIDICDNIDDPNDEIDYSDFINCKNISIPHKNIPNKHIISIKDREEIRDWVLEMLATSDMNPSLSTKENNSNSTIGKCIITCTQLFDGDIIVKCRSCHQFAQKASWNLYVDKFNHCPWCKQNQAPIY